MLSSFTTMVSSSADGIITITPMERGARFPEFTAFTVVDGKTIGWANPTSISKIESFDFGKLGDVEPVSYTDKKVVFKKMRVLRCLHCGGLGKYLNFGGCYDCKGTGEAVEMVTGDKLIFQGVTYTAGQKLKYLNSAGKPAACIVNEFYVGELFMKVPEHYPAHVYPLKVIWYRLTNTQTNATAIYPLWKSISLKKLHELPL